MVPHNIYQILDLVVMQRLLEFFIVVPYLVLIDKDFRIECPRRPRF